jgi:threonine/homoserine/homoserine lactone efflux protein
MAKEGIMTTGARGPRGRFRTWLSSSGTAFVDALQSVVALGGLLAVVALQIPWLQDPLERVGAGDGTAVALTV